MIDWMLTGAIFVSLNVGLVVGFNLGKAWGRNLGWHAGYHAAHAFYRLKVSHERAEPPSKRL